MMKNKIEYYNCFNDKITYLSIIYSSQKLVWIYIDLTKA